MSSRRILVSVGLLVGLISSNALGQANVRYNDIADPFLFLVREAAVHAELKLTAEQRRRLEAVNDRNDQTLLASRIHPPDRAREEGRKVRLDTQEAVDTIFNTQQRKRLEQLTLRVKGVDSLSIDSVATELQLGDDQRQRLESISRTTKAAVDKLAARGKSGESLPKLDAEYQQLLSDRQKQSVAVLTDDQRRKLGQLLGPNFETTKLGHVRFKAPELVESSGWLNSQGVRLADLRGQVIVLHFWTFG